MKKNLKRFMSIFLSTAMAVTIIPSTTYAMEEFKNDYEFSQIMSRLNMKSRVNVQKIQKPI